MAALQAGKDLRLTATACHGAVPLAQQPEFTWSAAAATRDVDVNEISIDNGLLHVGRNRTGSVVVTVSYTNEYEETITGTKTIVLSPAEAVTVTLTEPENKSLGVGQTLTYTAGFNGPQDELGDLTFTWKAGTSEDNGVTITEVEGITIPNGVLTVADDYDITRGDTLYVQAVAKDTTIEEAKVISAPVTILKPTSVEVKVKDNKKAKVKPGGDITLEAVVKNGSAPYSSQRMEWSVVASDGSALATGTGVEGQTDGTGILTAGLDQLSALRVTVKSAVDKTVLETLEIVVGGDTAVLAGIDAGSETTANIDGFEWYVVAKSEDNTKALILCKDIVQNRYFHYQHYNPYNETQIRTLLGTWLNKRATLRLAAEETDIYYTTGTSIGKVTDKAFLLSEADVFGTEQGGTVSTPDASLFTAGSKLDIPSGALVANLDGTPSPWWLRSVHSVTRYTNELNFSAITAEGSLEGFSPSASLGVRPAMWVRIFSDSE